MEFNPPGNANEPTPNDANFVLNTTLDQKLTNQSSSNINDTNSIWYEDYFLTFLIICSIKIYYIYFEII